MAHFAQLNEFNIVIQVIVVNDKELIDSNGNELEDLGIKYCKSLFGEDTNWKKTSYNFTFRHKYAQIGDRYDEDLNAFIVQKSNLFPNHILNLETLEWEPPISKPILSEEEIKLGYDYIWDQELNSEDTTKGWIKTLID
jgi:hypothetical protein